MTKDDAKEGDILRIHRIAYSHFVIYIGNGEVIHRTGPPPSDFDCQEESPAIHLCLVKSAMASIRLAKLSDVAGDNVMVQVANNLDSQKRPFRPDVVVKRAKSKLGETGYNLFFKNCEHFVMWCRYGVERSEQAEVLSAGLSAGLSAVVSVLAIQRLRPIGKENNKQTTEKDKNKQKDTNSLAQNSSTLLNQTHINLLTLKNRAENNDDEHCERLGRSEAPMGLTEMMKRFIPDFDACDKAIKEVKRRRQDTSAKAKARVLVASLAGNMSAVFNSSDGDYNRSEMPWVLMSREELLTQYRPDFDACHKAIEEVKNRRQNTSAKCANASALVSAAGTLSTVASSSDRDCNSLRMAGAPMYLEKTTKGRTPDDDRTHLGMSRGSTYSEMVEGWTPDSEATRKANEEIKRERMKALAHYASTSASAFTSSNFADFRSSDYEAARKGNGGRKREHVKLSEQSANPNSLPAFFNLLGDRPVYGPPRNIPGGCPGCGSGPCPFAVRGVLVALGML